MNTLEQRLCCLDFGDRKTNEKTGEKTDGDIKTAFRLLQKLTNPIVAKSVLSNYLSLRLSEHHKLVEAENPEVTLIDDNGKKTKITTIHGLLSTEFDSNLAEFEKTEFEHINLKKMPIHSPLPLTNAYFMTALRIIKSDRSKETIAKIAVQHDKKDQARKEK